LPPPPFLTAEEQAAQWVARRNNGERHSEEQRAFLAWINASDENRRAYAEAEVLWEQLRGLDDIAGRQLAEARSFLKRERTRPARRVLAMAAVAFLAVGALWYADLHSYLNDATYRTALGERKVVDLADGSRLELNTNSAVAVHYSRHGREVQLLGGQAVFSVVHDDSRPFVVLAGEGKVRDIGTQFEVRRQADRVSVAVLDGVVEVEVTAHGNQAPLRIKRGQRLSYGPSGALLPLAAIDINTFAAWREGKIVFENRPLGEVLEELGRYRKSTFAISAPGLLDVKVSGTFPIDDMPLVMRTVATALPAKITETSPDAWRIDPR
jgi:transmembrane sensor